MGIVRTLPSEGKTRRASEGKARRVTVAVAGIPNCGKTTLLNQLTHTNASVGNYPRVTVDIRTQARFHDGYDIEFVDLPGVYAMTSHFAEERAARDFLNRGEADIILNVIDAGSMERSLFLSTQLIETGRPVLFVFNMIDEARHKGVAIDRGAVASMLGGPVAEVSALTGEGVPALLDRIVEMAKAPEQDGYERALPKRLIYDDHLEAAVQRVEAHIRAIHDPDMDDVECRWLAIKLLEGDDEFLDREADHAHLMEMVRRERYDIERGHGESAEMLFADARYGFVHGVIAEAIDLSRLSPSRGDVTRTLDAVFLHRFWGIPIFFGLLWTMFQVTFEAGAVPMDLIGQGVDLVSAGLDTLLPTGLVRDLVIDGIVAGVGGTIVFLPNIVLLFLFMALFSETGYLSRAAFLMDRVMHMFGLHGKALIPLVMGFGCNVPAVMATRSIESRRSRLVTILINPFMCCSARMPVFILFAGTFFQAMAGTMVFAMYMISIIVAVLAAVFLGRVVVGGQDEAFVMELPPYRMPTLRGVLYHMWDKANDFLQKVAGVILVGSIIIWSLQAFPLDKGLERDFAGEIQFLQAEAPSEETLATIRRLEREQAQAELANSYLGQISRTVAPAFEPLGFSWIDTAAILTGFVAKEVVVATYAVLYAQGSGDDGKDSVGLRENLRTAMSPLVAFAFMLFTLLYSPCIATIAAIRQEAGGWAWAAFSFVFSMAVAWNLALLVIVIGGMLQ